MIKNIIVKHSYNFNCTLLKYTFNQISMNKIYYLNNCLYAPANNQNKSFYIKSIRIKAFNKTFISFISYNHFKGSKKAFNYKSYKSIKLVRFWLVAMLKGFKSSMNKIIRLKIYKWGLVEKMILISSFGWRDIIIKKVRSKKPKLTQMP